MIHQILIKNREGQEGLASTGSNTVVYLDGEMLSGVKGISFSVNARGSATVKLEMFAEVQIETYLERNDENVSE